MVLGKLNTVIGMAGYETSYPRQVRIRNSRTVFHKALALIIEFNIIVELCAKTFNIGVGVVSMYVFTKEYARS